VTFGMTVMPNVTPAVQGSARVTRPTSTFLSCLAAETQGTFGLDIHVNAPLAENSAPGGTLPTSQPVVLTAI
jgi:hypothetical protein